MKGIFSKTLDNSEAYLESNESVTVDPGMSLEAVGVFGLDPFVTDMGVVFPSLGVPTADGRGGIPA